MKKLCCCMESHIAQKGSPIQVTCPCPFEQGITRTQKAMITCQDHPLQFASGGKYRKYYIIINNWRKISLGLLKTGIKNLKQRPLEA